MEGRELSLTARDGHPLAATLFEPAGGAAGSVLINPAAAVRRRYYAPYASYLAGRGLRAVTFDYRGIGASRPRRLRGFDARMRDWAELDASAVLGWIEAEHPGSPLLLVGHSFGGQSLGLLEQRRRLRADLLVAAQSGYWKHWSGLARLGMALLWYVAIPALTGLFGYFPARRLGIGEDMPAGVAREWARWGRRREYLLSAGGGERRRRYAELELPILAYSFEDDGYAPRPAVEALLGFYSSAEVEHRHLGSGPDAGGGASAGEGVGHFGFFRERFRDSLWRESADWLQGRL